jgi:membrane protease YdiL (CAAX protease family)
MSEELDIGHVQTPAAATRPFPGIWPAFGWVALFILLQIVAGIIAIMIAIMTNVDGRDPMELARDYSVTALPTIWALVLSSIVMLSLLWLYLRRHDRVAAIRLDQWSALSWVRTLGLALVLIGAGLAFNWAYGTYIVPDVEVQGELRKLFAAIPDTIANSVLLFVAVALVAPLLEELLFRGLLQNSLAHKMPIWGAIAVSALVFGAMHMDLYALPPLILMGAIFGLIYHLTDSLRVTILLHMINNAAALAFS